MGALNHKIESLRDDLAVWRAFKRGDAMAYGELYERYVVVLYQYAYKISGNADVTRNCVQDLFIDLWKSKFTLGEPESVKNFLLKLTRAKAIGSVKWQLRELEQEAGFLKFFAKLSYSDVSAIMGIDVSTAHDLISNVVCNLKTKIVDEEIL